MKVTYFIKIFLPLLLICACIAGVVSGIYVLTSKKISDNQAELEAAREQHKLDIIKSIFGDTPFNVVDNAPETVDEIRKSENGEYCVTVTCDGYQKDGIQLFAAFSAELEVKRVVVLSSSETNGIGTKVSDEGYLKNYEGKKGMFSFGNGVDKIAGATLSSKAVLNGINTAISAISEMEEN